MSSHDTPTTPPRGQVISLFGGGPSPEPGLDAPLVAPDPPPYSDPRQARSATLARGKGRRALGSRGPSVVHNFETGMAASSVDLGSLQSMLEDSLVELDLAAVHARWELDVRSFLEGTLLEHVQRVEELELELGDDCVEVRLETRDDHGRYGYRFELMPRS